MNEDLVNYKLTELRHLKIQRDTVCGSLEHQIQEFQEELRRKALPFDHQSEIIEFEIKTLMRKIEHTIKTVDGAANFRKGGVRTFYDYKALDSLCASCEDIKAVILPFRKETLIKPTITVEILT